MKRLTIYDKTTLPTAMGVTTSGAMGGLVGIESDIDIKDMTQTASIKKDLSPRLIEEITYNGHLNVLNSLPKTLPPTINIVHSFTPRRHLHITSSDKSSALNSQIDDYAHRYATVLGMSFEQFGNPSSATPIPITVVGRIVSNNSNNSNGPSDNNNPSNDEKTRHSLPPSSDGIPRLREGHIWLESSRQMGSGCRIALDISQTRNPLSLFPGQIACLEGINTNMRGMGPSFQIISQKMPMLGKIPSTTSSSPSSSSSSSSWNGSILIVAGPFTTISSKEKLDYKPLERLLHFAHNNRPDVLIMLGPFIDVENPLLQQGALSSSPEQHWQRDILGRIRMLKARLPHLSIIMVPSPRDLLADPIFPQPPQTVNDPMILPDGIWTSNPSILSLEGVQIALSTAELFLPLGASELSRDTPHNSNNSNQGDRFRRLVRMIEQQSSFYPLQPAYPGINLDHHQLAQLIRPTVDIVINVSQLRCFAVKGEKELVINPGILGRHTNSLGTVAMLYIIKSSENSGPDYRVDFYQF